jgi:prepilin peptidase CpaA
VRELKSTLKLDLDFHPKKQGALLGRRLLRNRESKFMLGVAPIVVPSVILLAGVIDDLRSRKVHNELVLVALLAAAVFAFFAGGTHGIFLGLLSLGAALLMTLPLTLFGILGAGDMKLFLAFGLCTTWETVVYVGVAALAWGAILGVLRALVGGEIKSLVSNTFGLLSQKSIEAKELHRIPYTVALFMGWMSYLASTWRPL